MKKQQGKKTLMKTLLTVHPIPFSRSDAAINLFMVRYDAATNDNDSASGTWQVVVVLKIFLLS